MRLALAFLLGLLSLCGHAAEVPSVALYYASKAPLDELKAFDIAIVDPDHGYDPVAFRRPDSELYAYVSVGEVHPDRAWLKQLPQEARLAENADWGSIVVNLAHPAYAEFFASQVVEPLWKAGYRGFFLDTLDSYRLAKEFDESAQQKGLIRIIETLHARFPGIALILNRGFEVLPAVHDKVRMVAAESLFQGWDAEKKNYREVGPDDRAWLLQRLLEARDSYGLPVLAIDYVSPEQRTLARATAARIKALGIVPWVADADLSTLGVGQIEVMPRKVLVLYDAREAPAINQTLAHRYIAMPLNHMGYLAEYHDINQPLPGTTLTGRYAGAVIWLDRPADNPRAFAEWIRRQLADGIKMAFIGRLGLPEENAYLQPLQISTQEAAKPAQLRIGQQQPMFGFETPPRPDPLEFVPLKLKAGETLLELLDETGNGYSAAALMPWGGFVLAPFVVETIPGNDQARWVIDPFAFLQRALELPAMPAPDTTTENGRRLLFVHIDGDGFPSRAELPGTPLAGRVLLDQVLKRYALPTSMSVIEAEISPDGLYPKESPEMEAIAREMFALPHVEIASHSYSHPFHWDDTVKHGVFANAEADESYHLPIPGYDHLNLDREIRGSVDYIRRRLAPAGKPVQLFQWSGDTEPNAKALQIAYAAGLLNLNGGDTQITRSNPSLTAVSPLGIVKNGQRQVYAPITNENIYTNLWHGPYYGYRRVIETFELTESPRRLKPIDLYFHTYSASKRASLEALQQVYRWALAQKSNPIFPSDYVKKVLDFDTATIARDGEYWIYRGNGSLRTLRIPGGQGKPDPASAQGVAGFVSANDSTYIHLVGGNARFRLDHEPSPQMMLHDANARIKDWRAHDGSAHFTLQGHVPVEFSLMHAQACTLTADGRPLQPSRKQSSGILQFRLDHDSATIDAHCRAR